MTQLLLLQSVGTWQGKTHLPYCVLQWARPHWASLWQGKARGPGVESELVAVGAGAGGAGAGAGAGGGATGVGAGAGACMGAGAGAGAGGG